ncbi:MAG: hypothetical protein ABI324_01775, partial [Ktedonobacteraceae bacterium]
WAKAGLMLRQSTDPGSPYYAILATPGNGIVIQYRTTQGGGAQQSASTTGTVPTYLMVARSGSTFTAYTSSDGATWTAVAGSSVTMTISGTMMAGMAVTAHNGSAMGSATFDTVHIKTTAPPPPGCVTNWSCADIGNPTLAGSQAYNGGTWTIQGAGGDIWGASDQFHFVSQSLTADGSISAHVTSQTNSDPWAKAGVMLRQSSDPGSVYYAIFVTPANGIVMQYRSAQGGNTLQSASLAGTVPAYLRVARSGNTYTAYTSSDGATWTPLAGSSITLNMSGPVLAGMAVTSHNVGVLATDTFDTVSINTGQPCSSGWNCADIGSPALAGGQTQNGGTWTIQASGTDIFGTADQFHFVSQSLAANGHVSARIVSQTSPSSWAKAGVMLRQSNDPSSVYYAVFVTPGHGIVVQYRTAQGGGTHQITGFSGTVPTYLMVARSGNTYTAYTSSDGSTWTLVAGTSVTLTMSGSVMAGMAGTSHNPKVLGSATFDTVSISTSLPATCPGSWNCSDVGSPTLTGNQSLSGSTWTIQASGTDIFGPSDQFHFVSQSLAADGSVSAHVVSQQNTSGWAKSGVMLRQSTDPGSAYYAVFVTPANGIVVQYRTAQGGGTHQITGFSGTVPTYLMVARSGNTYTAYTSSDGSTWTPLAGSSATLTMNGAVLAGMAVTSHNAKVVGTVTFDAVNVSTTVP